MRIFGAEAIRDYLGVLGMVAVIVGVAGLSATFIGSPTEVAALKEPIATVIAWQAQ